MSRGLYNTLIYALSPLVWKRIWREHLPDYSRAERLGWIRHYQSTRVLWVHAASVGEVMTAAPVIRELISDNPDHRVVITTMTATGAERVKALFGDEVSHHFVALDFPRATRRMVRRLAPELLVIVETELWPNLIHAAAEYHVPITMINARISERSFKRYMHFRKLVREMLLRINWVAVKSEEDGKRFRALGMPASGITIAGALKYDVTVPEISIERGSQLREHIGSRPVWIAASVRDGEEQIVLEAHKRILHAHPDALLIMVPRHPQRFDEVAELCNGIVGASAVARRGRNESISRHTRIYLGDTMGELMTLYASADIAFVGGSLVPIGGHNLLEPAALGVPVLSGPELGNIREVADELDAHHARVEVTDATTLAETVIGLIGNPERRRRLGEAALNVVKANQGAGARICNHLHAMTHPESVDDYEIVPSSR